MKTRPRHGLLDAPSAVIERYLTPTRPGASAASPPRTVLARGDRAVGTARDTEQIQAAAQTAEERFGGVDVPVDNAGIGYFAAVEVPLQGRYASRTSPSLVSMIGRGRLTAGSLDPTAAASTAASSSKACLGASPRFQVGCVSSRNPMKYTNKPSREMRRQSVSGP
ncbi:hypothetical protein [Streptomyces mirabilis]|uniref:hypothetical protein n=1 Tax=Streptomyces mirabilis TaxID=68239 RepID=UPI003662FDA5